MAGHQEEQYFQVSSTLDKYSRISKNQGSIKDSEIRVKSDNPTRVYVGYTIDMLEKFDTITVKATGNAIPKAVNVIEVIKRKIPGLHQVNKVKNVEVEDTYEPLEEGLDTVVIKRHLSLLEVTLTKKEKEVDTKDPGYQEPLDPKVVAQERRAPRGQSEGGPRRPLGQEYNRRGDQQSSSRNNRYPTQSQGRNQRPGDYRNERQDRNGGRSGPVRSRGGYSSGPRRPIPYDNEPSQQYPSRSQGGPSGYNDRNRGNNYQQNQPSRPLPAQGQRKTRGSANTAGGYSGNSRQGDGPRQQQQQQAPRRNDTREQEEYRPKQPVTRGGGQNTGGGRGGRGGRAPL